MIEVTGDIWEAKGPADYVCVTTNGTVRKDGSLVMGGGIALEAAQRYPWLPKVLGECVERSGLQVEWFGPIQLIAFPVKYKVHLDADLHLIEKSTHELVHYIDRVKLPITPIRILIPRPGCGLGRLSWDKVKPVLERYLTDDRYVIFSK